MQNQYAVQDANGQTSARTGQRVWIMNVPGVPRAWVGAVGTIESIFSSGRVRVIFDEDDSIRRRLAARGVDIQPCKLTLVNPYLNPTAK